MRSTVAAILLLALSVLAEGHGGAYRAPRDRTPTTPGPGGPGTGPAASGVTRVGAASWSLWWAFQREAYLPRHSLEAGASLTAGSEPPNGAERSRTARASWAQVQPSLLEALSEASSEIVDSSVLALGRSAPASSREACAEAIRPLLRHRTRSVREAALLALGLLACPEDIDPLLAVLLDQPQGRVALRQEDALDERSREIAAMALGFAGALRVQTELARVVEDPRSNRDLASACIAALGLLPGPARDRTALFARWMQDPRFDRSLIAHVPIALHRLPGEEGRALLGLLSQRLGARDAPAELRQSVAISLGVLARPEDEEAVASLIRALTGGGDLTARHHASLALGRIAERSLGKHPASPDEAQAEFLQRATGSLLPLLDHPNPETRSYAALALGMALRHDRDPDRRLIALAPLRAQLVDEKAPHPHGALAIGLGLARDLASAPALRRRLESTGTDSTRGFCVQALGLMGDRESLPQIREAAFETTNSLALRIESVRSLGLLKDTSALGELLSLLRRASSLPQAATATLGLALVGDRRVQGPLLDLLQDGAQQDARRAYAAVALGILCEPSTMPWNLRLAVDTNPTLRSRPIEEILSLL